MRIIITTFGSLGDLFPYIAIAKELKARGVDAAIASIEEHKPYLSRHGIEFIQVGMNLTEMIERDPDVMRKSMDPKNGSAFVLRELVMPNVRKSYEDLLKACNDIDLFVTHPLSYHTILVSRKKNIPFVSTILSPVNFWSKFDPPAMPGAAWLPALRSTLGATVAGLVMTRMKNHIYAWGEPYRRVQADLGLDVDRRNIFFEGQHSPIKTLGLFSPVFAAPQVDWPTNSTATGFPFLDTDDIEEQTRERVRDFLEAGDPPVVFTLGSSAIWDAGEFYFESAKAAKLLNKRAVLLTGINPEQPLPADLPESVIAVDYLPHNLIFRHACAVVHQGGIGTTAQALRSARPQLIVPYSHDQFDNAARVQRLRCGLSIGREQYRAKTVANLLSKILLPDYRTATSRVSTQIQSENGAQRAAEEIMAAAN